jgi:hypothetical protein
MIPINPKIPTIIKHVTQGRSEIVNRIPQNSRFLGDFLAAAIRSPSPQSPTIAVAIIDKGLTREQVTQVFIRAIGASPDDSRDRTLAKIHEIERLLSLGKPEDR